MFDETIFHRENKRKNKSSIIKSTNATTIKETYQTTKLVDKRRIPDCKREK